MKFHQQTSGQAFVIRSYTPGSVVIARFLEYPTTDEKQTNNTKSGIQEETFTKSVIITPKQVITDWPPQCYSELRAEHFSAILDLEPEVVLLGTGMRLRFPPPATLSHLHNKGIGVEVMDSAAACRTYNILMADERGVVAAILHGDPDDS